MKISKVEYKGNNVRFIVENTSASVMNELRRVANFEVPVLAIEDVYFVKNSSALYDEIIAHRLGLIPLKTDLKTYNSMENCTCKGKGCAKCQVKLALKIAGPCSVYAKDLVSTDKSVKPVHPDMLIVKIIEGQEIELEAIAILGKGTDHTKWNPGLAFYGRYPKISINSSKINEAKEGMKHCPKDVFKNGKVANLENCDVCLSCADRSNNAIKVSGDEDKFIFTFEGWGQLAPSVLFQEAVGVISNKLKEAKLK